MPASLVNHTGFFESLRLPQNDRAFERKTFRTRSQFVASNDARPPVNAVMNKGSKIRRVPG